MQQDICLRQGYLQKGPTCYLHAMLNALFFSDSICDYLWDVYDHGNVPLDGYWKAFLMVRSDDLAKQMQRKILKPSSASRDVHHFLDKLIKHNPVAVLADILKNSTLFRRGDYALFNTTSSLSTSPPEKTPLFLFAHVEEKSPAKQNYKKQYRFQNVVYTLRSAVIGIHCTNQTIGHAICGYICKDKAYIYDSNLKEALPCNWLDREEITLALKYENVVEVVYIVLIYQTAEPIPPSWALVPL